MQNWLCRNVNRASRKRMLQMNTILYARSQAAIKQCGSKNGTTDSISSGDEHSEDGMAKTILANPGTPNPFE